MIVVKAAVAYRAAYEPIAGQIIEVDTPGLTAVNPLHFEYHDIRPPAVPVGLRQFKAGTITSYFYPDGVVACKELRFEEDFGVVMEQKIQLRIFNQPWRVSQWTSQIGSILP